MMAMELPDKSKIELIGNYFMTYMNLYLEAPQAWRKAISDNKQSSMSFIFMQLICYVLFVLIIVKDLYLAIPLVILDAALTVIPYLIFVLPLYINARLLKINIKGAQLFRLLLIIKLQYAPLLALIILFVKWSEIEFLYVFIDNFVFVCIIGYIIILPLILNIKIWQKLGWILSNYISILLFFLLVAFGGEQLGKIDSDFDKFPDKISICTPHSEFVSFNSKVSNIILFINNDYYIAILNKIKTDHKSINTQLVTYDIAISFMKTRSNQRNKFIIDNWKKRGRLNTNQINQIKSALWYPAREELTKYKVDSSKIDIIRNIDLDIKLTSSFIDSSKFNLNREFYIAMKNYLVKCKNSYTLHKDIFTIIDNGKNFERINLDDGTTLLMCKIDSSYFAETKREYLKVKDKIERRNTESTFVMTLLLFPFLFIS